MKFCVVITGILTLVQPGHTQPHKSKVVSAKVRQASSNAWQSDPALLNQLAPEVSLGAYAMRPPTGYQLEQEPEEGVSFTSIRYRWKGKQRADQTYPAIAVTIVSPKPGYKPNDKNLFLKDNQLKIQGQLHNYAQSEIEEGSLDNIDFARIYWKGIDSKPISHVHGFTYKGVDNSMVDTITIISVDSEPYNKATLPFMEAAAETFHRK